MIRNDDFSRLEINLSGCLDNYKYFRSRLEASTKLLVLVKANAYGHGAVQFASLMEEAGADYLAVAYPVEGVELREAGIRIPIMVLTAGTDFFNEIIDNSLEPGIPNLYSLKALCEILDKRGVKDFPVHIKLDTGMHRLGFMEDDIDLLGRGLHLDTTLHIASIFSHLSSADMPSEDDFTREQIERFEYMSSQLTEWLDYEPLRHIANSAAILRFPEAHYDMCRLGLGLYGFGYEHNDELIPVATLSTRIVQIKSLAAGESIGYGRAQRLDREAVIATIPVGYADGLDRDLGCGRWSVRIKGESAPIIGRVCMDSAMVDISNIRGVEVGDTVTIFSAERGNTLEDMARVLDTISYEIMTSISQRVKRVYTER